ncbi:MAG TPA: SOS response-associated peptidase [Casimicrobiaceae bacterium]|nr:SOS response-associated peptidase [Casimicrobiaceae bacterium]
MCGRYELHSQPAAIALAFGLDLPPDITPRYNIAPTQLVPIVRVNGAGQRELVQMRWGLVPRWARDPSIGAKLINARGETAASKASFRAAYRWHRCLVPANGFYEWMPTTRGKQPVHVGMSDNRPFGLAGLYERWLAPDGEALDTCTIVTTEANALLHAIHERMPLIVAPEDYDRWLDPEEPDPADLIASFPENEMRWRKVSTRVNSVKNDDANCITALVEDEEEASSEAAPELPDEISDEEELAPVQTSLF